MENIPEQPQQTTQPPNPTDPQYDAQKPLVTEHPSPKPLSKPVAIGVLCVIVLFIAILGWVNFFRMRNGSANPRVIAPTEKPLPTITVQPSQPSQLSATPIPPTVTSSVGKSGIDGMIVLGPTCSGTPAPGDPCMMPYEATVFVLSEEGNLVTQFRSGTDGKFVINIPAGTYILDPQQPPGNSPYTVNKQTVTVPQGRYAEVSIIYDTGIQ